MLARRTIYGLFLAALLSAWAGCGGDTGTLAVETDEPLYREGQQLEKQGRTQEALVSYLKLISRRQDQAPESHLEAGLISLENIKDPIAAIYHFRRYLELEPNSHRAPLVREELERAKREFAATLPAQHWETGRTGDVNEDVQRLENENTALKAEIGALRANAASNPSPLRAVPTEPAAADSAPALIAPVAAEQRASGLAVVPVESRPIPVAPAAAAPPVAAKAAPAHSGRTHVVTAKETLFSLSQRYYGDRTHWKQIRDANRDKLKGDRPTLSIGMELKIP
jgi:tetratricopeptide (TPR) repeat protein